MPNLGFRCCRGDDPPPPLIPPDPLNYEMSYPSYDWVNASGGTAVYLSDDNFGGPYNIGFNFTYFDNTYTQFYIGSNGLVTFGAGSGSLSNQCVLPNALAPNNVVALMWDDLDPGDTLDPAYYEYYATCPTPSASTEACMVIQYDDYHHFPGGGTIAGTFEVVLYEGGDLLMQFQDTGVELGSGSTTGIEGSTGTAGVTHACNTANSLTDGTAICYYSPGLTTGCH
jgi:hypothetical protein